MAEVAQVRAEGSTFQGPLTAGSIPSRYKKMGIDRLGQLSFITRGQTRFLWHIHSQYPKSRIVDTREPRTQELQELDRTFTVAGASTGTDNHTTFAIANSLAEQLQANDVLYNTNLYVCIDWGTLNYGQVATGTNVVPTVPAPGPEELDPQSGHWATAVNYSRAWGPDPGNSTRFYVDLEPMLVLGKGAPNGAGAGLTQITVKRTAKASDGYDFGGSEVNRTLVNTGLAANGGQGQIRVGDVLVRGISAWADGSGPAVGLYKHPYMENNFTQQFKIAVEMDEEADIESLWMSKKPLDIQRMLVNRRNMIDMERTFLFGQKNKTKDNKGSLQYMMGGVIEYIPKDAQHIFNYAGATLNYPGWLDVANRISNLGGGERYDVYVGLDLYTDLKKAFYNSGFLRYDPKASARFDIPIEVMVGTAAEFAIHPVWTFQEVGFNRKALFVDATKPCFNAVTHSGWDMVLEKDIQTKGTAVYKEQLKGIKGLERRYGQYMALVSFD